MPLACSPCAKLWLVVLLGSAGVPADEAEETERFKAGWNGEAPYIESVDQAWYVELGGRFQLDFRAYSANFAPPAEVLVRRARLKTEGTVNGVFEFKIQGELADDEIVAMRDVFVNVHAKDEVQVMAGQFKAPFSQEEFQSSKYVTFVERSMLNNLVPDRSPGVMVHGHTGEGMVQYAVSMQQDAGVLQSNRGGGPDVFGQGRVRPWQRGVFETLSFGAAFGAGTRDSERLVAARTASRSVEFFDEIAVNGTLVRRNVEAWWYPGSLSVQAEYDDLSVERRGLADDGGDLPDVRASGFMVQAAWVLTGEMNHPDDPIVPERAVTDGGIGAWEVAARYQRFTVGGTSSANRVNDFAVALNWWLNRFVRYQANASWERFRDPPAATTGETANFAFVTRVSVFF